LQRCPGRYMALLCCGSVKERLDKVIEILEIL